MSSREKANVLNSQFQSVFSTPSDDYEELHTTQNNQQMKEIEVSESGVLKQLQQLKTNKAAGPDALSPLVLRELATTLSEPLTTLFQTSLDKGHVPEDWKKASVCPIFKKGQRCEASNYRPVSLTCGARGHKSAHEICREQEHLQSKPAWIQRK
jgi:hypothetical protein